MRSQPRKQLHKIILEFPSGATRVVKIKAISRGVAEQRALKFHPTAIGVKPDGS